MDRDLPALGVQRMHEDFVARAVNALPYGMRRIKILAHAAGERDLQDRMRVWFGGVSMRETQYHPGTSCAVDAS